MAIFTPLRTDLATILSKPTTQRINAITWSHDAVTVSE